MYKWYKKFIKKYVIHLIVIFVLANSSIVLIFLSKAQNASCMTQSEIDSDSRCLYIYHNEVYEKGTRSRPHQRVPCGENVDTNIPNLHFSGGTFNRFKDAKVSAFCTGNNSTPAPTQAPTQQPTATATATSTPQATKTATPTQQPTATATATSTATQSPTNASQSITAKPSPTNKATQTSTAQSNQPTSTPNQLPTESPTALATIQSGNTFGELLGRLEKNNEEFKNTQKPSLSEEIKLEDKNKEFNLTSISKPITYASIISVIGSLLLIIIF